MSQPLRVCIVGSGNWGSVIAKIVGNNVLGKPDAFVEQVLMYVYEEIVDGMKLTDIINTQHENIKYLPGCMLPHNVIAVPKVIAACQDADILVFVVPHQFMQGICSKLQGHIKSTAIGVSLMKGLDATNAKLDLISNVIRQTLNINCAVLMGANIAGEVALEHYCETTIGCRDVVLGRILKKMFETPYFRCVVVPDADTVEICGALKNVVALGAGFTDGMKYGDNTKAAVIRLGLMEMVAFTKLFFPETRIETFLESCGVADLVTTCYSGRNRKVAEAFSTAKGKTLEQLESEMLNGQKLQGPPTAAEINTVLKEKGIEEKFPLFTAIHEVCIGKLAPEDFIDCLKDHPEHG